jgi:hypothetical protein
LAGSAFAHTSRNNVVSRAHLLLAPDSNRVPEPIRDGLLGVLADADDGDLTVRWRPVFTSSEDAESADAGCLTAKVHLLDAFSAGLRPCGLLRRIAAARRWVGRTDLPGHLSRVSGEADVPWLRTVSSREGEILGARRFSRSHPRSPPNNDEFARPLSILRSAAPGRVSLSSRHLRDARSGSIRLRPKPASTRRPAPDQDPDGCGYWTDPLA